MSNHNTGPGKPRNEKNGGENCDSADPSVVKSITSDIISDGVLEYDRPAANDEDGKTFVFHNPVKVTVVTEKGASGHAQSQKKYSDSLKDAGFDRLQMAVPADRMKIALLLISALSTGTGDITESELRSIVKILSRVDPHGETKGGRHAATMTALYNKHLKKFNLE